MSPISAVLIGAVGGALSFFAIAILKRKLGYDDALDAFGCHGVAGIWGSIATAIFASKAINPAGSDGLIYGNFALLKAHLISTCATALYAAVATFVILKVMSLVMGLRATSEQEAEGLDISLHGEEAYSGLNM